jgi:ATP-binding cassette subfamily B protein
VAVVGPSGAGKSTLVSLLLRLHDPAKGEIRLDGRDLRRFDRAWLRAHVGVVTQETYLFHGTLLENLLYARPEASRAQVEQAARAAQVHEFIASLPEGYETVVGRRGFRLSGGERQRVAIARVILKDPRILILDEATSSLDSRNESLIQAAIDPLLQGRTSLVIAHRLSTIRRASLIAVFDQGHLREKGTHEQLIARDGLYAQLYKGQLTWA